jgi:PPK2 family polyphosphate:nucleotide phosphotransferase
MFEAPPHRYRVPFDGSFELSSFETAPPEGAPGRRQAKKELAGVVDELEELQRILYAHDHHAVLLVFQAMDAAGKDGTIRKVLSGVNPAGCQVFSFKAPSQRELDHDFLWRTAQRLPERGRIGVFNRSYYEEVLVVRVHPEFLVGQRLGRHGDETAADGSIWEERFESIRDHERHIARNGTVVLKFFLNVSREEQRQRFLSRLDEPEKNWKFSVGDVKERGHWDDYMHAYEEALRATSRPWAPWYAIPADDKDYMRLTVARIVVESLRRLDLNYPEVAAEDRARFEEMRALLEAEAP